MSGEETGKKTSAEKVVAKMRVLCEKSGKNVFRAKDYLSVDKVTSMFSRLAAQKKKKQLLEPTKQTKNDNQQKTAQHKKLMMKKIMRRSMNLGRRERKKIWMLRISWNI